MVGSFAEQIVTAFEVNQMTPEEITQSLGYDTMAVKSILQQHSRIYREIIKEHPDDNAFAFNDEERVEAKNLILNVMRHAEDEHIQAKLAMYVRDDSEGRLDFKKAPDLTINMLHIGETMKRAVAAKERSKAQNIEIPAEVKKQLNDKVI